MQVSTAVFEAVLPRSADDILPATPAGALVSLADKIDSLVGLFAAGCAPTASADPYGLRRTAYGFLQALVANNVRLDLGEAIAAAAAIQPIPVAEPVRAEVREFLIRRLEQLLVDRGVAAIEPVSRFRSGCAFWSPSLPSERFDRDGPCPWQVRAVLSERSSDPCLAAATAGSLSREMSSNADRFARVMAVYSRPTRIIRGKEAEAAGAEPTEALLEGDEEKALFAAFQRVADKVRPDMPLEDFLAASEEMSKPVADFFDKARQLGQCPRGQNAGYRIVAVPVCAGLCDERKPGRPQEPPGPAPRHCRPSEGYRESRRAAGLLKDRGGSRGRPGLWYKSSYELHVPGYLAPPGQGPCRTAANGEDDDDAIPVLGLKIPIARLERLREK